MPAIILQNLRSSVQLDPPEGALPSDPPVTRREAFIQSLRDCADFLAAHPTVTAPRYVTLNIFVNTRDEVVTHAKVGAWEKVYNADWFYLRRSFGEDLSLDVTAPREEVCRRVVVGTRDVPAMSARTVEVVEWVCDEGSILSTSEVIS
jgi:hypothetical protein